MILHPYQERAITELRAAVLAGQRRPLLVAPTGAGKTVTVASLIQSAVGLGSSVLVVVHRIELVTQMRDTLARFGISAGVIKAKVAPEPLHRVQIGTIQSLVRRELPAAQIVIVDEAHRASADSYESVRAAYPEAVYIGLTATPCRENGRPIGDVFDALIEVARYSELIEMNAAEPSRGIVEPIVYGVAGGGPDLADVRIRGDYVVGELEIAMNKTELVGGIVEHWQRLAEGRRTLVFAVGVAHSQAIAAAFTAAGVVAAHLDGTSPEDERPATLARFAAGEIAVLCNCNLFIEGLDIPSAKCAVLARPTKSLALYMQGVGRVLRPWNGITPLVLDHAGNVGRHGLPHEDRAWSLTDAPKRKDSKTPYRTCPECFGYIAASSRVCPLCGHNFLSEIKPIPKETNAQLERIDAALMRERAKKHQHGNDQRVFFDSVAEKSRRMGFKPGFASAKYKEKYGQWPPWAWSQELREEFARDVAWQARQADREVSRAHWQNVNAQKSAPEEQRELDEGLSDWLERQN